MYKMSLIKNIIILNGIYDILCSLAIIHIIPIPILDNLHIGMFLEPVTIEYRHLLAYFIFVNGVIRLVGGYYIKNIIISMIVAFSYFIEAGYVLYETFYTKNIIEEKGYFVIGFSLLLGALVLYI